VGQKAGISPNSPLPHCPARRANRRWPFLRLRRLCPNALRVIDGRLVLRNSGDSLRNGIAVLLPVPQGEKNKKDRRSQGEQVLQIIWNAIGSRHGYVKLIYQ